MTNNELIDWIKLWLPELNSSQIGRLRLKFEEIGLQARIDTAETALQACPTKDDMLRVWLTMTVQEYRKELQAHPTPGSDEAIEQGCSCPVLDNGHGAGIGGGQYWIGGNCPMHGHGTAPNNNLPKQEDSNGK